MKTGLLALLLTLSAVRPGWAEDCRAIVGSVERLACWDAQARRASERQEHVIYEIMELDEARSTCGYEVDTARLKGLIVAANLTMREVYELPRSPALRVDIDGLRERFATDSDQECRGVWKRWGPDAASPGFLVRKGS